MNLRDATLIGNNLCDAFTPVCESVLLVGAVRRGEENPGDIDIVVIPERAAPRPVFGQKTPIFKTFLDKFLWELEQQGKLRQVSGGDKYRKYELDSDRWGVPNATMMVKMQLTLATPENWAYWCLIRTGPSEFSRWLVTPKAKGGAIPDGIVYNSFRLYDENKAAFIETPTETDWLFALGLPWIEPKDRTTYWRKNNEKK